MKAGAVGTRPEKLVQGDYVIVNLDKTLATGAAGPVVTSDSGGRVWLVIGTDSGFEGFTRLYYLDGATTLTPT